MKTLVVVQARTKSSRLPGKVLMPLAGAPLLTRLIERVTAAQSHFDLVVATTTSPDDDRIRDLCRTADVRCVSGHPTDLLERHYQAAISLGADAVVKIPSDCPLIDPAVVDRVLSFYSENPSRFDYVSNLHPPSYPDGNDVEVMSMAALERAWIEANRSFEREHTTPFLWDRPKQFRIGNVKWETGLDYSMSHRWTVDYVEDYAMVSAVYDELWSQSKPVFSINDILSFLADHPDVPALNKSYAGVNWYRHHLHELKTKSRKDTRVLDDAA
ncbi:MAG TPA: glycosyltransferase family protein [Blastocatellia bacterium]|nr:glycosyltransferase family protein [Blastocatellia bacterium]